MGHLPDVFSRIGCVVGNAVVADELLPVVGPDEVPGGEVHDVRSVQLQQGGDPDRVLLDEVPGPVLVQGIDGEVAKHRAREQHEHALVRKRKVSA